MTTAPAFDSPWMSMHRERWLREVESWLRGAEMLLDFGSLVSLTSVKERPWAAVLHARFQSGSAYSKAPGPLGRTEAPLLEWLQAATNNSDLAPRPLTSLKDTGWMLLADSGSPLREVAAPDARLQVVVSALIHAARSCRKQRGRSFLWCDQLPGM